jgi:hypothetical protein
LDSLRSFNVRMRTRCCYCLTSNEESRPVNNFRISRDDLESRFKSLQDDIQGRVENRKQTIVSIAAGVGVVLVVLSYLVGRRRGSRKATRVEFRRR